MTHPKSDAVARRARAAFPQTLSLLGEYLAHPAIDSLRELRLDHMTPIQAFDALRQLHAMVEAKNGATS